MSQTNLLNWSRIENTSRESIIAWIWKSVTNRQTNKKTNKLMYWVALCATNYVLVCQYVKQVQSLLITKLWEETTDNAASVSCNSRLNIEYSVTSTGLYRSCAALAHFSGTFDLIIFEAVNFEFIVEKVWFGEVCFALVLIDGLNQPCFALVEFAFTNWVGFGLVLLFHRQTNK